MSKDNQQNQSNQIISEEHIDAHQEFLDQEIINTKKKELLTDFTDGYKEIFGNDLNKIVEHFKKYGIRVANLKFLMTIRAKISGMKKFYGLGVGPLVGVIPGKNIEAVVNHETVHTSQYIENSPITFLSSGLKARLGFISFGVIQQLPILTKLKAERKKYGIRAAAQYATKNTPMEFEAFLQEENTAYLETRKPFAYKQYETLAGRSLAIIEELDNDILKRVKKIETLLTALEAKQDVEQQDIMAINEAIEQLVKETKQIVDIKTKYGSGDRELVGTMEGAKGALRRAEPKQLVLEKRLPLLEKLLAKEHACVAELKKNKNVQIISSQDDMDEHGIIKIQAKGGDIGELLQTIQDNPTIKTLLPHIVVDTSGSQPYIRIVFVA